MATLNIDPTVSIDGLLTGQYLGDRGAAWASQLVEAAASAVGLPSEVRVSARRSVDAWPVELCVSGRPLIRIDVDTDGASRRSLDRLELQASRIWRSVTRDSVNFKPRPWLGSIRIATGREPSVSVVERLTELVATRTLDAACVAIIDEVDNSVRSPNAVMSIEAFQAALVGRCLYLTTLEPA